MYPYRSPFSGFSLDRASPSQLLGDQDWGSMVGEITLGEAEFFSDLWRTATDPNWGKDLGLSWIEKGDGS